MRKLDSFLFLFILITFTSLFGACSLSSTGKAPFFKDFECSYYKEKCDDSRDIDYCKLWLENCVDTCQDNIQNNEEEGIDCGGSCDPCSSQTDLECEEIKPVVSKDCFNVCVNEGLVASAYKEYFIFETGTFGELIPFSNMMIGNTVLPASCSGPDCFGHPKEYFAKTIGLDGFNLRSYTPFCVCCTPQQ